MTSFKGTHGHHIFMRIVTMIVQATEYGSHNLTAVEYEDHRLTAAEYRNLEITG